MKFNEERALIETHFADLWSETEIAWSNVPFEPPANLPWVRFTIVHGEGLHADINGDNPLYRFVGNVMVQVFVPIDTGTDTAFNLAETVSNIFRRAQLDNGIQFRVPYIIDIGPSNNLYQINVTCPYWRNQFETT